MREHLQNSILALVIAAGICLSFYYLERSFRGGDSRRAVQAVQHLREKPGDPTVEEQLKSQYGADTQLTWVSAVEDNFRGILRVVVTLPDGKVRRWRVDLVHGTVAEL